MSGRECVLQPARPWLADSASSQPPGAGDREGNVLQRQRPASGRRHARPCSAHGRHAMTVQDSQAHSPQCSAGPRDALRLQRVRIQASLGRAPSAAHPPGLTQGADSGLFGGQPAAGPHRMECGVEEEGHAVALGRAVRAHPVQRRAEQAVGPPARRRPAACGGRQSHWRAACRGSTGTREHALAASMRRPRASSGGTAGRHLDAMRARRPIGS